MIEDLDDKECNAGQEKVDEQASAHLRGSILEIQQPVCAYKVAKRQGTVQQVALLNVVSVRLRLLRIRRLDRCIIFDIYRLVYFVHAVSHDSNYRNRISHY